MLHVGAYSRTCSSKATYGERGVGPARREDCCPRMKASLYPEVYPGYLNMSPNNASSVDARCW